MLVRESSTRLVSLLALVLALAMAAIGAEYDPAKATNHWAFQPVKRPVLPQVSQSDWVKNPIDRFILHRLDAAGLKPSGEADRYTLIRRVYLDLIGLPPSVEEVDAYVADKHSDAFQNVVRRLLANQHYGEKWGRHWLDQGRYADSNGYTIDSPRVMWPYRDWVINALNRDLPFDQFTIEQIAGDLLPGPTQEQLIATGFHRNTLINQEGGTDAEQFRVESVVDRVNTTGTVWLGLTIGCAQCHTHKFDPITIEEYYQFYAFFNSTEDKNNTGPTVRLQDAGYATKSRALAKELTNARAALVKYDQSPSMSQAEWEKELAAIEVNRDPWKRLEPVSYSTRGKADIRKLDDQSLLVGPKHPDNDVYSVATKPNVKKITAIRLDALPDKSLPKNGPGLAGNGNFVMTGFEAAIGGKKIKFHRAAADHEQPKFPIENVLDDKKDTGWAINIGGASKKKMNEHHWAIFYPETPIAVKDQTLEFTISNESVRNRRYMLGRFALSLTEVPEGLLTLNDTTALLAAVRVEPAKRTKKQISLLQTEFQNQDPARKKLAIAVQRLQTEKDKLDKSGTSTMVMKEMATPRESMIHLRGDFLHKGEKVQAGVPAILPPMATGTNRNRLALAKWLIDPANPLTARVTVNRVWMRYFGTGLVGTDNDFGTQGTPPTHPELLDWLASEFIRQGWSMKKLHELIVTSATYRQTSHRRPEQHRKDPVNKLLARQNRLRVEAELVRDLALAVSGKLSPQIGGPSVHPPQPDGVYNFTQNKKKWDVIEGPQRYRRTLYTFFYRSAPYPMLTTFDVPDLSSTCTSRPRSNTPLQSLTMSNDEGLFETAQAVAGNELAHTDGTDEQRMTRLFRRCLARPPSSWELSRLGDYLNGQRKQYVANVSAARKLVPKDKPKRATDAEAASWVMVARAVMNLDEFITRE